MIEARTPLCQTSPIKMYKKITRSTLICRIFSCKAYCQVVLIYYSSNLCFVAKKRETEDSSDDEPLAKKAKSEAPSVFTIIHHYFQEKRGFSITNLSDLESLVSAK